MRQVRLVEAATAGATALAWTLEGGMMKPFIGQIAGGARGLPCRFIAAGLVLATLGAIAAGQGFAAGLG